MLIGSFENAGNKDSTSIWKINGSLNFYCIANHKSDLTFHHWYNIFKGIPPRYIMYFFLNSKFYYFVIILMMALFSFYWGLAGYLEGYSSPRGRWKQQWSYRKLRCFCFIVTKGRMVSINLKEKKTFSFIKISQEIFPTSLFLEHLLEKTYHSKFFLSLKRKSFQKLNKPLVSLQSRNIILKDLESNA